MTKKEPKRKDLRGYTDEIGGAIYAGYSRDQFKRLQRQGVMPLGRPLTPNGKHMLKYADIDAAIEKAWRSRKPRRKPRGIVRQRIEEARVRRSRPLPVYP